MKQDRVRILTLERYKLLKEAEKLHQKAQEVWRKYLQINQEKAKKIRQANLVENQIYVGEFKLEPISINKISIKEKK